MKKKKDKKDDKKNKEFKLLAIRPLKGCDDRFLKNLKEGEIYKFYNEYEFVEENGIVTKVKVPTAQLDLYSPSNSDLKINISAVVGKNGSGKSSLIELLFVAVYIFAVNNKILDHHDIKKNDQSGIDIAEKNNQEKLLKQKKKFSDILKSYSNSDSTEKIRKKTEQIKWHEDHSKFLENLKEEIKTLRSQFRVEIFYQIDKTIFCLRYDADSQGEIYTIPKLMQGEDIHEESLLSSKLTDNFFYSLVLNYSQYALNSKEIGNWIIELFHKNDAYQTPIVINPMRTEGNFNINTENDLVRQRLLANILTPLHGKSHENSMRQLAQGHIAYRMSLEFKAYKFENEPKFTFKDEQSIHWKLIKSKFGLNDSGRESDKYDDYARQYILNKLGNIAEKYPPYYEYGGLSIDNFSEYLDDIKDDNSHIAYKFHQAINYLKFEYASTFLQACTQPLDVEVVSDAVGKAKVSNLMHVIPPSFFKVEVYFDKRNKETKKKEKETNTLQHLSSGEKQHIYAISSIMYHLRYLNSVDKDKVKHKYKYINLIFDEVELYYHPELQRTFINDLLEAIKRCDLKDIKSINCIFITHSPFILSDIPVQNLLRLENGKPSKNKSDQTFGANIHQLLHNEFFLENGFIGEFARETINEAILYFTYHINIKEINELKVMLSELNKGKVPKYIQMKKSALEEENLHIQYKLKIDISLERKEDQQNLIELIGENIIRLKLNEMVELAFPNNND